MKNGKEIAERRWWERNKRKKEKTTQQQKGLPTLSADLNEREMAGNSNHIYQLKSKNTRLKLWKTVFKCKLYWKFGWGWVGRGLRWFEPCLFYFLFFYCSKAKRFYVWVCVSVLFPRIEPVGKPYREVCLQTKWWPLKVNQPNSWSKRPGTRIGHVLAYCCVGRKYVGCIELLFKLYRAICIF